jgi:ariadne-1
VSSLSETPMTTGGALNTRLPYPAIVVRPAVQMLTYPFQANTAALLLRHMSWNKERLTEKYMDNADAVMAAAGIIAPPAPPPARRASPSASRSPASSSGGLFGVRRTTRTSRSVVESAAVKPASRVTPPPTPSASAFVCPICFDDTQTDTLALDCEHAFCTGCWSAYTASKIRGEGEHAVQCMAEGCQLVANDEFVRKALAGDKETWVRFQELLVRDYVAANKRLKFCPYPSCTYTVSCPAASTKSSLTTIVPTVTCGGNATHQFCFGCDVDADHRPCVCAVARMWLKKCADDSETANWIKSNTKECSKCQSTIEKNGGCKYVSDAELRLVPNHECFSAI